MDIKENPKKNLDLKVITVAEFVGVTTEEKEELAAKYWENRDLDKALDTGVTDAYEDFVKAEALKPF